MLYEFAGTVAIFLLFFHSRPVNSILWFARNDLPLLYMPGFDSAYEVCMHDKDLNKIIGIELNNYLDYKDRNGKKHEEPRRHRYDPIIYSIDARPARFQTSLPKKGSDRTPSTWYCDLRCGDTRPKFGGNLEDFLPPEEPIENNVRAIDQDLLQNGINPAFRNVTGYVPIDELKYTTVFRIICRPGEIATIEYFEWYQMPTPSNGPRRTGCRCELDPEAVATREPGLLRQHQDDCYDMYVAAGPAELATWFTPAKRGAPTHGNVGPSHKPYQSRPLVDDFHLYLAKGYEVKHRELSKGEIFEYGGAHTGETYTACAHNPNNFDVNVDLFSVQHIQHSIIS